MSRQRAVEPGKRGLVTLQFGGGERRAELGGYTSLSLPYRLFGQFERGLEVAELVFSDGLVYQRDSVGHGPQ